MDFLLGEKEIVKNNEKGGSFTISCAYNFGSQDQNN